VIRRLAIVGLGLLGGSVAKGAREASLAREIVAVGRRRETLEPALRDGVVDRITTEVDAGVRGADFCLLATPVATLESLLPAVWQAAPREAVLTDVGSTKSAILYAAQQSLPQHVFFVGGHPLAGSEQKGVEFARADLFENSTCILTPVEATNRRARDRVKTFWNKVGAQVKIMEPSHHDQALSYVSHLPHLAAYALMDTIPANFLEFSAQGLKDTTRIAASSPQMWNDICMANSKNLTVAIDEMVKRLSLIRKSIVRRDQKQLSEFFKNAKTKRDALT
jgi:prephenate dehydrogenase